LSSELDNEIKEPPPNTQEDSILVIDDENPQEPWKQEKIGERIES
jgi:hypothetical protein